jgi:hypothetical protein
MCREGLIEELKIIKYLTDNENVIKKTQIIISASNDYFGRVKFLVAGPNDVHFCCPNIFDILF